MGREETGMMVRPPASWSGESICEVVRLLCCRRNKRAEPNRHLYFFSFFSLNVLLVILCPPSFPNRNILQVEYPEEEAGRGGR